MENHGGGEQTPDRPEAGGPSARTWRQALHQLNSERILLGEDEPSISMLLEAVLGYRGYQVVAAFDGEEVVRKYKCEGPFDLVILDLNMPRLDGCGALRQIRALNPAARALLLSGSPMEDQAVAPGGADFDGRLGKPFDNDELVRRVRQILDLKKAG